MKHFFQLAVFLFCGAGLFAESPARMAAKTGAEDKPFLDWSLLWLGSWEESKTLHNRGEIKLNFLPPALTLRGEVLDRHTMNFELDPPWGDPDKGITNFAGGLYHKPTGSRLLYGVLDEWGLSARIRNPWIRSAPFAESHKPLMADLKTAASGTKEDEAYLYLSSPFVNIFEIVKLRGFVSAQTAVEEFTPAISGGLDAVIKKNMGILIEGFYTGSTLPPTKSSSWFSYPPPLPEREFNLYAVGFLFTSPLLSVSSDWAYSQSFAWGADIYGNLGVCITPPLSFGVKSRPLSVSFSADGAGERFIYRDGANHGEGFRTAGKIEWKGARNSLLRLNTTLRGTGFGENFHRSTSGFYYRFPANNSSQIRMTRVSLTAARNADNPQKISDTLSGYFGISLNLPKFGKKSPFGVNFSGSVKSLTSSDDENSPSPYPFFDAPWVYDSAGASCELTWSPVINSANYQFKSKLGYMSYAKKDGQWDVSFSASGRFKHGNKGSSRLTLKAASADFPEKWNYTVSWRLELKNK